MINVLMIEDDYDIAMLLTKFLKKYDISITNFECPELGLSSLTVQKFDLVILDLSLPGIDGVDVCKLIRKKSDIPIIISSARSDIKDKTICYNYGADDYIPKPYDPEELVLRIKAMMKRSTYIIDEKKEEKELTFKYDLEKMEIYKNNKLIELTPAEYNIFEYLIKRNGFPVSRQEALLNIDSIKYESNAKSIDVIVGRIRQKIEVNPKKPEFIISVRGVGYKFINK